MGLSQYRQAALVLSAGWLLSACLLTDEAGIQPLGSVKGSEARILVQNAASAGGVAGISFHNLLRNSRLVFDIQLVEDSLVAGFLAKFYVSTRIEEDAFYTTRSVRLCLENVTMWTMTWTIFQLDVDRDKAANERNSTATLSGAGACRLVQTGRVLHVGNAISF